ncbi:MAG TPA: DUF4365 domain-containing protein [Blastocatellia bacterium]|nr:DUF4365 domain-containing protein [Blastocatellia bacterium]
MNVSSGLLRPRQDIGVDLYCETVADGRPFLHFWLQVKAGDQCKRDPSANTASCAFELEHLDYWARQPVPVFAALVPSGWPVLREPDIHIIDVTTQILTKRFPTTQQTVTLSSDYGWPAGDRGPVLEFLAQVVPDTTARLQLSKGVVADSPTPTSQYVRTRPRVPVLRFKDEIRYQLRRTATNAILFSLVGTEPTAEDAEFRRLLARIVEQFGEDPHWENFFSLAVSSHADEDYLNAVSMYEKARQCIQNDENVRDKAPRQELVGLIERLEEQARCCHPLREEELTSDYAGS